MAMYLMAMSPFAEDPPDSPLKGRLQRALAHRRASEDECPVRCKSPEIGAFLNFFFFCGAKL